MLFPPLLYSTANEMGKRAPNSNVLSFSPFLSSSLSHSFVGMEVEVGSKEREEEIQLDFNLRHLQIFFAITLECKFVLNVAMNWKIY